MCCELDMWEDSRNVNKHVRKIPHQLVMSVAQLYFYGTSEVGNLKNSKCQTQGNMIIAQ
jgi:hypothetical protein